MKSADSAAVVPNGSAIPPHVWAKFASQCPLGNSSVGCDCAGAACWQSSAVSIALVAVFFSVACLFFLFLGWWPEGEAGRFWPVKCSRRFLFLFLEGGLKGGACGIRSVGEESELERGESRLERCCRAILEPRDQRRRVLRYPLECKAVKVQPNARLYLVTPCRRERCFWSTVRVQSPRKNQKRPSQAPSPPSLKLRNAAFAVMQAGTVAYDAGVAPHRALAACTYGERLK